MTALSGQWKSVYEQKGILDFDCKTIFLRLQDDNQYLTLKEGSIYPDIHHTDHKNSPKTVIFDDSFQLYFTNKSDPLSAQLINKHSQTFFHNQQHSKTSEYLDEIR